MNIMVTGGAGYIGSHTCVELIGAGHSVLIFDNFSNSHPEVLQRIGRITGTVPAMVRGDIRDSAALARAFAAQPCDAVIHLAGLKSVGESVSQPRAYHDNNVGGTQALVQAMRDAGVGRLVFASSATVYGEARQLPITEDHPLAPTNPYGQTKLAIEQMLGDLARAPDSFAVAVLRFFNPVGAHESGLIGEDPIGVPGNLMPCLSQVAVGQRSHLTVFGRDYDTPDGTCIRDYVHVMDIAAGHLRALQCLDRQRIITVNLGTGRGCSVLELTDAFSKACGRDIALAFAPRRDGDAVQCYASAELARQVLGWRADRDIGDMCRDAWRWQSNNPDGYGSG
jgi:UDP-glucose 4-epimerase